MHTNPRDHTYGILVHAHLTTPLASKIRLALFVVNSVKLHLIALKFPCYSLIHPIIRQQTRHLSNTFNKMNFYQCILPNGVNESPWWVKMKINFHVVHLYSASMDDTILKILSVSVILFVILDNTTIALSREFFLLCFCENQGQKLEKSVSQVKKVSKGSGVNSDTTFCLSAKLTMVLFFELENPARPHCRINPIVSSPFKQQTGLACRIYSCTAFT